MTATLEPSPEVEKTRQTERSAEVFFLTALAGIVGSVDGLRSDDAAFDFCIPVPASRLHEIGLRIAELEIDVQDKYGVAISAMPIPVAG